VGKPTTDQCLEMAIEGETHEFTYMYPTMAAEAKVEGDKVAEQEALDQANESKAHAQEFQEVLDWMRKAEKRFKALKGVEERHAAAYKAKLEGLK
jgi:rubrerythrin